MRLVWWLSPAIATALMPLGGTRPRRLLWRRAISASTPSQQKRVLAPVLWRFSRPHTLIGTMVCVPTLHLLAAPTLAAVCTAQFWASVGLALLPAMLVNVFITGVNQISDVEIDKINKPELPLPAGELTPAEGVVVCSACLAAATGLALWSPLASEPLSAVLFGSVALGAAYSMPPFRLKRWPLLAALSIVAIRGALVNVCFFNHAAEMAFQNTCHVPRSPADAHLGLVVAFFGLFGVAIALMKDVPDLQGDKIFKIPTLAAIFGRPKVFSAAGRLVAAILATAAALFVPAAALAAAAHQPALAFARLFVALAAAAMAKDALSSLARADPNDNRHVKAYYMRVWRLFYLSYAALPLAR